MEVMTYFSKMVQVKVGAAASKEVIHNLPRG